MLTMKIDADDGDIAWIDYLGGTVQVIPHITDEIKRSIVLGAGKADVAMVEIAEGHASLVQIVDQVVEVDEELMELYLEQGEELEPEQLHDPFEKALRSGHLVPVCFTSARTGAGIRQLLNIFEQLMPNPMEANPPRFLKGEGEDAVPLDGGMDVVEEELLARDGLAGSLQSLLVDDPREVDEGHLQAVCGLAHRFLHVTKGAERADVLVARGLEAGPGAGAREEEQHGEDFVPQQRVRLVEGALALEVECDIDDGVEFVFGPFLGRDHVATVQIRLHQLLLCSPKALSVGPRPRFFCG